MLFATTDQSAAALNDAFFVSEDLNGRVVLPNYQPAARTVVLMHKSAHRGGPDLSYDLTDEGDLRLRLRDGEIVLQGVSDPSEVQLVLRAQ